MNKKSYVKLAAVTLLAAIATLGTAQAAALISQPFADADGTSFTSAALVAGFTSYSGTNANILTASALTYPGLVSSGNGYGPLNGYSQMSIDLSPTSPLAAYIANGVVGGTGTGTLYISWMLRGAVSQQGQFLELRQAGNGTNLFGTLFSDGGFRLVAAADSTGGGQNYQNSNVNPSVAGTDFLVAKITFGPGNTDKVELFINQTTEGSPNQATGADRNAKFDVIAFGSFGSSQARFDELRVGATFADVAPVSAVPAPTAPSALQSTVNSFSEITLNWTDNSANELSFIVERSLNGTTGWTAVGTLGSNVATLQDTGLTASTAYYYRVFATNSGGNSAYSSVTNATTSALPALVALNTIYQPFADPDDGNNASQAALVPGVLAYAGPGFIQTSSALSYPGVPSSGNGLTTGGGRFFITLDPTLPGLARYMSGGRIGGSGLGVLYVSWMARGINGNEANTVEFRTGTGNDVTVSVGTTFGDQPNIRLMTANALNSDIANYITTTHAASAATDFYVVKFTFGTGNTATVDLFINQTTEGTPITSSTCVAQFNIIGFTKFGGGPNPAIDEFRIGTSFAQVVGATANPIQSWIGGFGLPADGTGTGAYTADPDGDGISNLLEYAFKGNPTLNDVSILPSTGKINESGSDYLTLTFERLTSASSGITYTPQASADLAIWDGVPVQVGTAVNNGDGTETVVYRDNLPVNGNPKRFLRVRVTAP